MKKNCKNCGANDTWERQCEAICWDCKRNPGHKDYWEPMKVKAKRSPRKGDKKP